MGGEVKVHKEKGETKASEGQDSTSKPSSSKPVYDKSKGKTQHQAGTQSAKDPKDLVDSVDSVGLTKPPTSYVPRDVESLRKSVRNAIEEIRKGSIVSEEDAEEYKVPPIDHKLLDTHPKLIITDSAEYDQPILTVHSMFGRKGPYFKPIDLDWGHLVPPPGHSEPTFEQKAWFLFHPYEYFLAKIDKHVLETQPILLNCFNKRDEALEHGRTAYMFAPLPPGTPTCVVLRRWWWMVKHYCTRYPRKQRGPAGARITEWNLRHPQGWEEGEYADEFDRTFDWWH